MIAELVGQLNTVSILGMCKNAGKTTVLNRMISEYNARRTILGLTSIGRDGESLDLVTGTGKPRIYVREGALIATSERLLKNCGITREILDTAGVSTSLGQVVVLRALSDGPVELAGPSMTEQLRETAGLLKKHGAQKTLIDGSISRKSLGVPWLCDGVILSTGAAYDRDINTVAAATAHFASLFSLPLTGGYIKGGRGIMYKTADGIFAASGEAHLIKAVRQEKVQSVCIYGAVTDALLDRLIRQERGVGALEIVAEDPGKLMLSAEFWGKLALLGARFSVLDTAKLICVTLNPTSPEGYAFDPRAFADMLRERVKAPVLNVLEEIYE